MCVHFCFVFCFFFDGGEIRSFFCFFFHTFFIYFFFLTTTRVHEIFFRVVEGWFTMCSLFFLILEKFKVQRLGYIEFAVYDLLNIRLLLLTQYVLG